MLADGVYILGTDKKVYSTSVFVTSWGKSDPASVLVVRGSRVLAVELFDRGVYDFVEAQRISKSSDDGFRCPTRDDATIIMWAKSSHGLNEALWVCTGTPLRYLYWTQERRPASGEGLNDCLVFGDSFDYVDFDSKYPLRVVKDVVLDETYDLKRCSYVSIFIRFLCDYCNKMFIPQVNIPTLDVEKLSQVLSCVPSFAYLHVLLTLSPEWHSFLDPFFRDLNTEWMCFLTGSVFPRARCASEKLG